MHFWGKDDLRKSPPIHVQTAGLLGSPEAGALTSWGQRGEGHQILKSGWGTRSRGRADTQRQAEGRPGQAVPLPGSSHPAGVGDEAAGLPGAAEAPSSGPIHTRPWSTLTPSSGCVQRAGRLGAWVQRQPVSPSPKASVSSSVERILLVSSSASDLENLRVPGPLSLTPGLSCTAPSEAGTSGLLDTIQGAQLNLSFKQAINVLVHEP